MENVMDKLVMVRETYKGKTFKETSHVELYLSEYENSISFCRTEGTKDLLEDYNLDTGKGRVRSQKGEEFKDISFDSAKLLDRVLRLVGGTLTC